MNIFDTIKQETGTLSHKTAVIEGGDRITYGQLIAAAEQFAEALRQRGVSRLHRVGLLCDDSIDYIVASLAILSLSAVVVPVSPEQTDEEVDTVIDRIGVDFLIAESGLHQSVNGDPLPSDCLVKKQFTIAKGTVRERPKAEYFRINPAFIRFSSGTTGTSKGVVLSHEAIIE